MTNPASRVRLALDLLAYRDEVAASARRAHVPAVRAERQSLLDFAADIERLGGRETAEVARRIAEEDRAQPSASIASATLSKGAVSFVGE